MSDNITVMDIGTIYKCSEPKKMAIEVPLVYNSPHSGDVFPNDFDYARTRDEIREGSDLFVDTLFDYAPQTGAYLLAAQFPRSYIDVNRAVTDIDTKLLRNKWDGEISTTDRSYNGIGLVRRLCKAGVPVYNRLLWNDEIHHRIDNYYMPYHEKMALILDGLYSRYGKVWHIDCHSMPSQMQFKGNSAIKRRFPDFILGDRDGTTCTHEFRNLIKDILVDMGYSVRVNEPYKGVEMVRRYGNPCQERNSIQIEINKDLYMDEQTLQKTENFEKLKNDMNFLMDSVAKYIRNKI